ncbi:MAG: hypothetical protein AAB784_01985 [Patescibacteria group bacterium]
MPRVKCFRIIEQVAEVDIPDDIYEALRRCGGMNEQELKKGLGWYVNYKLPVLGNRTPEQAVADGRGKEVMKIISRIEHSVYF